MKLRYFIFYLTLNMQGENKTMMWVAIAIVAIVVVAVIVLLVTRNNATTTDTTNNTTQTNNTTEDTTDNEDDIDEEAIVTDSETFALTEQNGSGQNGTVLLEEIDGQVRVTITLSNPSETAEPAHIHAGSCPTPGAVFFPLTDVVNGTSVTTLETTLDALRLEEALAVNVHKSAAQSGVYFSCGNLAFE